MDLSKISSPIPVAPRHLNQVQAAISGKPAASMPSTSSSEPFLEYKVRVPRHLAKNYYMMRFQSGKPDLSSISKATMSRESVSSVDKEEDILPKSGAGSEYGREKREEARKRRRGYAKKTTDPDSAPWNLKLGGKGGKRYSGRKEAGINDNSSYYILTQCPDGAFEAVPVTSWYNFTPNINYRTLTADEAEEEFLRRDKTVNFFSLMVKKRLQNSEEMEEREKEKGPSSSRNMKLFDGDDDDINSSDDDYFNDADEDNKKHKQDKSNKPKKGKPKGKGKGKKGSDDESNASSEEDGYFDSKEVDYMSDSSSSSEEERKEEPAKPDTKDDLNAESSDSNSEDDDDLTNAGKDIKKILQKGQGERGSSDEEDEDPDNDEEVKGTAAVLLQDKCKTKKKAGSRSSTSSSSRSSTPTKGAENQSAISTVQAAARKLEGRPGTPTGKGKKRPASDPQKTGFVSISDSPSSKKARISPGPHSQSGSNTPTLGDNGNTITEDSIRRYLARKPMTTKDLLQKFKSKKTGLTNEQTVQLIATILKKIQPEQNKIKGKLYLSLKTTSTS